MKSWADSHTSQVGHAGDRQFRESAGELRVQDYLLTLWRRRFWFVIPVMVGVVVSAIIIGRMPAVYRSTGTILIERQEIPPDLVQSTVVSYAEQRIEMISQRVLTTENLRRIIDKFHLFPDQRIETPLERLVGHMRRQFNINMESAMVRDPQTGRRTNATVAFSVSFDHSEPETALKVANELVSLYLEENLRTRAQAAADTSKFLESELNRLGAQLSDLELQISNFKRENIGRLPEQQDLNVQLLDRTDQELVATERQIEVLTERKIYLEAALAQLRNLPRSPVNGEPGESMSLAERLESLKYRQIVLSGVYADDHPDMVRLNRQIEALSGELGVGGDASLLQVRIDDVRNQLAAARDRYTGEHPDVVGLEQQLAQLEAEMSEVNVPKDGDQPTLVRGTDSPVAMQMQAELDAASSELASLRGRKEQLRIKRENLEQRITEAPEVERQYAALVRDRANLTAKYQELKAKQSNARIAESLEEERKAERFSLLEPPQLPRVPIEPNRRKLLALGAFASVFGGVGAVTAVESVSDVVRGAGGVVRIAGTPPVAAVPYIRNRRDRRLRVLKTIGATALFLALVAASLAALHFWFMPLDVIWLKVMQNIEMQ